MRFPTPDGYVRVRHGPASAVVLQACAEAVAPILASDTLYGWASVHPERRQYRGRAPAFAVPLAGCGLRVVVRHAWHGGLLGPLLRDIFLAPTRAPRELAMSHFLRELGVPTPPVVAYAIYTAGPLLRRADVCTAEITGALDLAEFVARPAPPAEREEAWRAVARLLAALARVGAWHPDLNAANVLLVRGEQSGMLSAVVLDVDRVRLVVPGDPQLAEANLERLLHSLRRRAGRDAAAVTEAELAQFAALARREAVLRPVERSE